MPLIINTVLYQQKIFLQVIKTSKKIRIGGRRKN